MTYAVLNGREMVCSCVPKRAEMVKLVTPLTSKCQIIGLLRRRGHGGLSDALSRADRFKRAGHDLAGPRSVGVFL